ncbi:MAG: TraB family protein [Methanobacteriota archaeon]|nr:MAG: TraB family protein [Euryarchaeota archaeon]
MASKSVKAPKIVRTPHHEFILVGTGHVMRSSAKAARQAIRDYDPDIVAVELDMTRFRALGKRVKPSLGKALKSKNKAEGLGYLALHSFQQKAGKAMNMSPGRDLLAAVDEAKKQRVPVYLIDRDIRVTMRRLTRQLTLRDKLNLVKSLVLGLFGLSKEDISEVMENKDSLMHEFKKELPTMYRVLVTERDKYMASMLLSAPPGRVVVVVGAGHLDGIEAELTRHLT